MKKPLDINWIDNNFPWLAEVMYEELLEGGLFENYNLTYEYDNRDTMTVFEKNDVLFKATNVRKNGKYLGKLVVMHRFGCWEYFCDDFWEWAKEQKSRWINEEGDRTSTFIEMN